jgi:hypothetical protein
VRYRQGLRDLDELLVLFIVSLVLCGIVNYYIWVVRRNKPFIIQTGRLWDDVKAIGMGLIMTITDLMLIASVLFLAVEHGYLS